MLKRIINKKTGIFIRDDFQFDESIEASVNVDVSDGLYIPKWTGAEWIENMPQEEIDELNNQPRELSEIELLKISQAEQFELILEFIGGM